MIHALFLLILFSFNLAWSQESIDIVFDIDQTIATLVHDEPYGDLLADPNDPKKGTVEIEFDEPQVEAFNKPILDQNGKPITKRVKERYRIYEGMTELMEKLRKEKNVNIHFFSGGHLARNNALLEAIKLSDSSSLKSIVDSVSGRESMTATGLGPDHRIRERFKKDLTLFNSNLENVILVDDIKNFALDSQLEHVLWLEEDFPYPERRPPNTEFIPPTEAAIMKERNRFRNMSQILLTSLEQKKQNGGSFAKIIRSKISCYQIDVFQKLNFLLSP